MLLNEGKFINTETIARHLYNHLMRIPEIQDDYLREFSHVRPFRQWTELYDEFYELVSEYRFQFEKDFTEMMKKMKSGFIVRYSSGFGSEDRREYDTFASIEDYQITIYKSFFRNHSKRQRIEILSHELMHMIQFLFPHSPNQKKDYYHQPHEIEALAKDIVYDIRLKIRRGKINSKEEARIYLQRNHDFQKFPKKFKRKMLRKIMLDLFYHNPITENLTESRYMDVGNLPEMMLKRIEDVLWLKKLPVFRGKDGAVKIRNKIKLPKRKEVEYGLFYLDLDLWKEFKKVLLTKYSEDLLDLKQTKKMYRDTTLTVYPNKKGTDGAFAFVNPLGLFLFKDFFNMNKEEQTSILHHEIIHLLQSQFPIFAGKYWEKMRSGKNVYEKDPFELQAYSSELVKMIGDSIKKNEIKSMQEVSVAITEHPYYQLTSDKYKKKMFQKIMSNVKAIYHLPTHYDSYNESINELLIPSKKLDDDQLIDTILQRKELRKNAIESRFLFLFFTILKTYNIEPATFINRYHKYVDGLDVDSISIDDIRDFLRFAGSSDEHSKVMKVLRISNKRLYHLKDRFKEKLLDPMKRIMRHDTTDATKAGKHFPVSGKRYNTMMIRALQKAEKVKTLKEKGKI